MHVCVKMQMENRLLQKLSGMQLGQGAAGQQGQAVSAGRSVSESSGTPQQRNLPFIHLCYISKIYLASIKSSATTLQARSSLDGTHPCPSMPGQLVQTWQVTLCGIYSTLGPCICPSKIIVCISDLQALLGAAAAIAFPPPSLEATSAGPIGELQVSWLKSARRHPGPISVAHATPDVHARSQHWHSFHLHASECWCTFCLSCASMVTICI